WFRREPPAACELTYTVRDASGTETPYTSVLQFWEYAQTKEIGGQVALIAQWAVKKSHMLEKCTEADVYRKAFPQDFSGVYLDDAMPAADPDAPPAAPERQRVTAAGLRQQHPAATVPSTVEPEDVPPAPAASPVAAPAAPVTQGAGGTSASGGGNPPAASAGQVKAIGDRLEHLGYERDGADAMLRVTARLAGCELGDPRDLTADQAAGVLRQLQSCTDGTALQALLDDGVLPDGEARDGE
ncbi:MAG TPA: hypothetical protein VF482_11955, partial [Trebonia sp.]